MVKKVATDSRSQTFPRLLPAQQQALTQLEGALERESVAILTARAGKGKSVILRELHARMGGAYLTSRDLIEASAQGHPLALEESVYRFLQKALSEHNAVFVDDFHVVALVSCCSHAYPRANYLAAALLAAASMATSLDKKLLFASEGVPIVGLDGRSPAVQIPSFGVDDYAALCEAYLGPEKSGRLDIAKIHRFAPKLNARQIRLTCEALRDQGQLDTGRFLDYLREHHMVSNVDIAEVQAVDLRDLKGLDDVLEALEANVVLPLEDSQIAQELDLKAKRGVLLAGPPGTGKTTIGRALARRLKSKFFLIDGTFVSGSSQFFNRIHQVFEGAKQNAPAIIFIDDSDVIFENSQDTGLYRYLLTMLDGLESASAGRVCVMMTAMDVGNLPPALVRSGRIELWLETRLPSEQARIAILKDHCAKLPNAIGEVDVAQLAQATEGLSGADLKRVVEDGKLLFAYERARGTSMQPATQYFLRAIETVRRDKEHYAEAEARARTRHPVRPSFFDMFPVDGEMMVPNVVGMLQSATMMASEEDQ